MKNLIKNYLKIINEDLNRTYYKNAFIDFSYLTEKDHFNIRSNDKNRNTYSDEELMKIIQDALDKFISDNAFKRYRDNPGQINAKYFTIISKSHDKIKIKAQIWKNGKKELAKAIMNDKPIVNYVCRLKTILVKDMIDHNGDIPIIVEEFDRNKIEILVD